MFLPTTREEMKKLSRDRLDVIIVTGDTYIDSPYIGAAVIGKVLSEAGYKVGIVAQPDTESEKDITRLGEPTLFWGVTAGSIDSMVANYTALKKKRRKDDFTPGGKNTRRPDRATIAYSNLIRKYFKNTKPIVLGGIEASLRRIAHYDYWDDKIRRAILFDAKADILVYGMGEKSVLKLARNLKIGKDWKDIRGICYISPHPKEEYTMLPSYQEVKKDKKKFTSMFHTFITISALVASSSTFQREQITRGAPAYMNARVSPTIPSPCTTFPLPVSHADRTTRSAGTPIRKTSRHVRKPSLSPTRVRASELSVGFSRFTRPWQARWTARQRFCFERAATRPGSLASAPRSTTSPTASASSLVPGRGMSIRPRYTDIALASGFP